MRRSGLRRDCPGLAFLYGLFVLRETLPPERRTPALVWRSAHPLAAFKFLSARGDLAALALSGFLLTFAQRLFMTVFVLFASGRFGLSTLQVGALLTFSSVLDFIVQGLLVGRATARIGDRGATLLGLGGGALSLLAMGFAPTALWFVVALTLSSLMGLAEPTIRSLMSTRVSDVEQGQLQGAVQGLASFAGIAGPLFFGWIYAATAQSLPGASFVAAAAVLALALFFSLGARRAAQKAT